MARLSSTTEDEYFDDNMYFNSKGYRYIYYETYDNPEIMHGIEKELKIEIEFLNSIEGRFRFKGCNRARVGWINKFEERLVEISNLSY